MFDFPTDGGVLEVNVSKGQIIGALIRGILKSIGKGASRGSEAWRKSKASRPLNKMGHAQKHMKDFKKIDPEISENEVAQILEHVRKTGPSTPGADGEQIFEKVVEIGGKNTLVRVVESAGGNIKTGYPVVP